MTHDPQPHRLAPNVIEHFYRGGERIAALRGCRAASRATMATRRAALRSGWPRRWPGGEPTGRAHRAGGARTAARARRRRPATAGSARPTSPAGARRRRCSSSCSMPANACPCTSTPTAASPPTHLGCPFGKTEAWVVLDVPPGGGTVFVGTTRPVRREEWAELVDAQAADAMLDLLHPVTRRRRRRRRRAGLDAALHRRRRVRRRAAGADRLLGAPGVGRLRHRRAGRRPPRPRLRRRPRRRAHRRRDSGRARPPRRRRRPPAEARRRRSPVRCSPSVADPYFRAWAVDAATDAVTVPRRSPSSWSPTARGAALGRRQLDGHRGDAFVVPHAAGPLTFGGGVAAIVAQPPAPDAPEPRRTP